MIKLNFDYVSESNLATFEDFTTKVKKIDSQIRNKTGEGNDFLGWYDWPENYDKDEVEKIKAKAKEFRENYETLVVCGIGGSYLGSNAVIDALNGLHPVDKMEIIYLGNTLSPTYITQTLKYLENKNYCICCISKSGTTTETSISFRILKDHLEAKIGKEKAKNAIVCVTDKSSGALRTLCNKEGYVAFDLPSSIGGRYSVITAVGLFPIACAGIDIDEFLKGCLAAKKEYDNPNILENSAYQYAVARHYLNKVQGYKCEVMCSYDLNFRMFNEWWKQLYGESEGKHETGIYPSSCVFTTDLHSLGQFIQEGSKILFETVIYVEHNDLDTIIPFDKEDLDEINYISGKTISYVNRKAYEGTLLAHSKEGKVPNITITLDELTPFTLGQLIYFFMKSCAMSGYLNGINPFNQPGVQVYKNNMFHLLGKKGY